MYVNIPQNIVNGIKNFRGFSPVVPYAAAISANVK